MTPEQEVLEAICIAVEKPDEWVRFHCWQAKATDETVTLKCPPGRVETLQAALPGHDFIEVTETSVTYRRPTFEESQARILGLLGGAFREDGRVNLDSRSKLERAIAGALRSCIHDHGPIDIEHLSSATKRVIGALKTFNAQHYATAKERRH